MSINVVGYKINRRSFTDLDNMLADEVINAYISLKCKEYQNKPVHFLSCEVMTSIFCGLNLDDPFPLHCFLQGVDIEEYDIIIGALHEAGCHWSLMVIFPSKLELIYLNPMGECREIKDIYLQKWLQFLSDRYIKGIGTSISEEWTITSKRHHKQMDSNSCGVFVLKFAELILKGAEDFRFNSTKKQLKTLRIEIGQYLVECSDNMQEVAITQEVGPSQHNDNDDVLDGHYVDDILDDRKMSVETCQVHYLACKEKLHEIVNCQETTCDLADHVRHHEFIANPLKVHNRERVTVGFGMSVIKLKAMEFVHEKLSADLLYIAGRDPKHPYTNRGTEMIFGMTNDQLEKRFKVYRLAPQYILHVLVKEMIVMIYIATHNSSYDMTNELCQATETNITTECRKLKKQKNNF